MIVGSSATADSSDGDAPVRDGQAAERESDRGGDETTKVPSSLPKDVVFGLLSAKRRRRVLEFMAEHGDQTTLSDLADHIAAMENDTEIRLLSSQQRKRVYVALYQCHLPKMSDADVVEFDKNRGLVEPGSNIDQLEPYLDVPGGDDQESVPLHYVVLATAGVVAYLLAAGIDPGGSLVGGVVLGIGLTAFVAMAARARTR